MITSEFLLDNTEYVKVSNGASYMFIQCVYGGSAYAIISPTKPPAIKLGHILNVGEYLPFTEAGSSVWMKAIDKPSTIIASE